MIDLNLNEQAFSQYLVCSKQGLLSLFILGQTYNLEVHARLKKTYVSSFVRAFVCSVKRINLVVIFVLSISLALVYFQARYVYVERDYTF